MTAQVVPTFDAPFYTETVTLDGVPYLLTFLYNQREDRWYLAIATVDGDPIYGAVKLVPNWPLFYQCVDARQPPGQFVVVSASSSDDSPPGQEELIDGARCQLLYIPVADVDALLATPASSAGALLTPLLTQATGSGAAPNVLDGMAALLPEISANTTGANGPTKYNCAPNATTALTIGGDPSYAYTVQIRVRGILEQKTVTGGLVVAGTGGLMNLGGTPAVDNSSVASLVVSAPAQTYYLNTGTSGLGVVQAVDYLAAITVQGGATVTLKLDSIDSIEAANTTDATNGGLPVSLPSLTALAQPYAGQLVQLNVGPVT